MLQALFLFVYLTSQVLLAFVSPTTWSKAGDSDGITSTESPNVDTGGGLDPDGRS